MNYRHIILYITVMVFGFGSLHAESLNKLLPEKLVNSDGEEVELKSLEGKIVALYFSAGWCPPCRAFTPSLVEFRNKHSDEFEVVFVSSDRTEEAMKKYMADYKMDFLAVKYDAPQRPALGRNFEVRGIPTLVILDDKGNLITKNGRGDVSQNAETALKTWQKQAKADG
ncbi:MAG: redoxin family protein [Verrucomicrobia bacterium]|nr:redoxin family protein [Verrucomicrobiota bacterium]MCH8513026.1 redoxin family protein [Kiritimatiellia bacterium]